MFDKLKRLFCTYTAAKLTKPYDPITIQGWGIAFATEWKAQTTNLCNHFGMNEEDMDYMKYAVYMPMLCRDD